MQGPDSNPARAIRSGETQSPASPACCERAASGDAAAAPPEQFDELAPFHWVKGLSPQAVDHARDAKKAATPWGAALLNPFDVKRAPSLPARACTANDAAATRSGPRSQSR